MKNFEWDENKREANLLKHGIDFVDAVKVLDDFDRIEFENTKYGEKRYQTIGTIHEIVILLVYTERNAKRRIISARRASKKERDVYYSLR